MTKDHTGLRRISIFLFFAALVSKRVYKEPMSFDQAARIMCEGMGTQFDPNMRIAFLYCRKQLEAYYSAL